MLPEEASRPADGEVERAMALYQAGNYSAFEQLYAATASPLLGYLRRWTKDDSTASDLLQETFLEIHRARRTWRPGRAVRPWIFAIARHVALDDRRTRARRNDREVGVDQLPEIPSTESPGDPLGRRRLAAGLERLPFDQREAVWLSHVLGMSAPEIGRVVGASAGTVKVRLFRAHRKLREWLGDSFASGSGN